MSIILQGLLFNTLVASGLATFLIVLQHFGPLKRWPQLCHGLWLLLLVKLVTPPLFVTSLPWPRVLEPTTSVVELHGDLTTGLALPGEDFTPPDVGAETASVWTRLTGQRLLIAAGLLGAGGLLMAAFVQQRRLDRLLSLTSSGPTWLQATAREAARALKLTNVPSVRVVDTAVAPFLWTGVSGPLVVFPQPLLEIMEPKQVGLVIKHELAHYARKDHWSGAIVSLACALMWWNPLVWWIRRETRVLQETCCDQLVLQSDGDVRRCYAEALMVTIDLIAGSKSPPYRPATAFGDGQTLKRRIEMIVSNSSRPMARRVLCATMLIAGTVVLPLGVSMAQDDEAVGKRLRQAVAEGELSADQAAKMMETLKNLPSKSDDSAIHQRFEAWVTRVAEGIKAAAENGDISEEEAWEKWFTFKERELGPRIRAAVAEGDFSETAARKLMQQIESDEVATRIRAAVARGEMTEEEGKATWARVMSKERPSEIARTLDWEAIRKRLGAAVDRGEMTREDAGRVMEGMRKRAAASRDEIDNARDRVEVTWEAIEQRIEGAVERGELTREEANAKYTELRKRMAGEGESSTRGHDSGFDWDRFNKRVEAAVKRGDLTLEEAVRKYVEMRKQSDRR